MQLMTRSGEPNEIDLESVPVNLPDGSQRNSIDQAIADMFVSNVNVEMLEGWEKFRFKVKDLVTWWFLAACFCFGVSVYANITEDNEGSVFDENIKWPYYISHFILGLSFYLLIAICYNVCVKFFDLDGQWVAALSGSILWYLSREVRDNEKLGGWDWQGLYAPTLGLVYVFIILQSIALWWKYKITRETKYVSRYAVCFLVSLFIGNTVVSIYASKYFPDNILEGGDGH
ncbi:hypothetical protein TrVE_jg1354 [Triparma verrucosa]|uniref:Uncharacterized protein n=2 Tax=Triparma TaxID=722752 RepID=A0A9W7B6L7_9STRA|nr:hypothetical protein TrST_g9734 [Triparma strigata]GMI12591.1 hypothetical protein TrVE_jg1354 [Triparma verrucosa]